MEVKIAFEADKRLARPSGTALGEPVSGDEIHHGTVLRSGERPLVNTPPGRRDEGAEAGHVLGTHWHGLLENDGFRRRLLAWGAASAGRSGFRPAANTRFAVERERQLDLLGDLVEAHLDTVALRTLIDRGAPPDLPVLRPSVLHRPG